MLEQNEVEDENSSENIPDRETCQVIIIYMCVF